MSESHEWQIEKKQRIQVPTGVLGLVHTHAPATMYAACVDGVYELDLASGHAERRYAHRSYVSSVAWLPTAQVIVSAGYDGQLVWYDVRRREIFRRVQAHRFWSWQMRVAPNQQWLASVTGQYLAGAVNYQPRAEQEPSVKIYDARTGDLRYAFSHTPSVQAVAFSPDSRYVAAGNLLGQIRVWDLIQGQLVADWQTPDFTSWGIIKSHCYLGGIFALTFTPDGDHIMAAGMGPMDDPMAGNGRQLWQRFAWREAPVRRVDETRKEEAGEGLMETLAYHPFGNVFAMGGRLRGGDWNVALFDHASGQRRAHLQTGYRVTSACFDVAGGQLVLAGCERQPAPEQGTYKPWGAVDLVSVQLRSA